MGNRYKRGGSSFVAKVLVADKQNPTYNSTVGLRLIYDAHLKIQGPVSGKAYDWPNIGSVVCVDQEDVDLLLGKMIGGRGCCGASREGNKLFERA